MRHSRGITPRQFFWHIVGLTTFTIAVALWIYAAAPVNVR